MNEAALKYKIYKILLESGATKQQRELMVELGIMDTIISSLKGAGKGAKRFLGALKDDVSQEKLATAQKNLSSAISDLKDIAKKAGKDESFVNALLQQLMQSSGADPKAVASASPEKAATGGETGGAASAPATGATITTQTISQNPKLVTALVSAATDKKPAEVAPKVEEKKPDATAVTKIVTRAAAKATGVKEDSVAKVIKTLFDVGRLKLGSEVRKENAGVHTEQFERWQRLAKLPQGLLVEAKKNKRGNVKKQDPAASAKDTSTTGVSSELGKVVRSKIKPEELSDADLNKVVNWVEEFLDKAAEAAAASEKDAK